MFNINLDLNLTASSTANLHGSFANLTGNNLMNTSTSSISSVNFRSPSSSSSSAKIESYQFLFTSDFERNSWLEEINGAIYACKFF